MSSDAPCGTDERPVLYMIGYSHLDTQWRWDYEYTIRECIRSTLVDNLALM